MKLPQAISTHGFPREDTFGIKLHASLWTGISSRVGVDANANALVARARLDATVKRKACDPLPHILNMSTGNCKFYATFRSFAHAGGL